MNRGKPGINWAAIHERLAEARRAFGEEPALSDPRVQSQLQARAARLAKRGVLEEQATPQRRVCVFVVQQQRLAIDLKRLIKVMRLEKHVRVPGGPPHLLCVANFDGQVRSVIDLAALWGLERTGPLPAYALVVQSPHVELAIAADEMCHVAEFEESQLRPPEHPGDAFLKAATGIGPDEIVLLDVDAVLGVPLSPSTMAAERTVDPVLCESSSATSPVAKDRHSFCFPAASVADDTDGPTSAPSNRIPSRSWT